MQVIFIDDELNILNGIRRQLHDMRQAWSMHFFVNAADALVFADTNIVNVFVTDIQMPNTDGFTLIQSMRELQPSAAPAVLTAYCPWKTAKKIASEGIPFLSKPCDKGMLIETIVKAPVARNQVVNKHDTIEIVMMMANRYAASKCIDPDHIPAKVWHQLLHEITQDIENLRPKIQSPVEPSQPLQPTTLENINVNEKDIQNWVIGLSAEPNCCEQSFSNWPSSERRSVSP